MKSAEKKFIELKKQLYAQCLEHVTRRMDAIGQAMQGAQEAANQEDKSSAGDKYETGRSMMHLDMERYAGQMAEIVKVKNELSQVDPGKLYPTIQPGSLAITSQGNFFIAISAGKIKLGRTEYFAVSAASPIGSKLRNLKAGDEIVFNQKSLQINQVG